MPLPKGYVSTTSLRNQAGVLVTPGLLVRQNWAAVPAKDADGFVTSHAGAGGAGTVSRAINGALAAGASVPRSVIVTVTHASAVVAMTGTITGRDQYGRAISEDWSVTAGGTSKTYQTAQAFAVVTGFTETVAADASTNTIIVGEGDRLGLAHFCEVASAVKEVVAGSIATNGVVVKRSDAAGADLRGTYAPNSAPSSTDYELWYIVQDLFSTK